MTNIVTATGAKLYISTAVTDTTDTAVEFAALTWTEVKMVQSISDYGDAASTVKFADLGAGRNFVAKGIRDAGEVSITVARAVDDDGQEALVSAEASNLKYAFKITIPNRLTAGGTDEINYFRGLVTSKRYGGLQNDQVILRTFVVALDSPLYEVAAT